MDNNTREALKAEAALANLLASGQVTGSDRTKLEAAKTVCHSMTQEW